MREERREERMEEGREEKVEGCDGSEGEEETRTGGNVEGAKMKRGIVRRTDGRKCERREGGLRKRMKERKNKEGRHGEGKGRE